MTEETDLAGMAGKLGAAQRRTILSLSREWGRAADHRAAKRLWWRDDIPRLLDHKHQTDNCWSLTTTGAALKHYIEKEGK